MTDTEERGAGARVSARPLTQMMFGFTAAKTVTTAARLRLADHIGAGARPVADLAAAARCHEPSLRRLLRALAGLGLITECDQDAVELTPLGSYLRSEVPESAHSLALLCGEPAVWQAWGALDHAVRTGDNAFRHVFGKSGWDYLDENPEAAEIFNNGMATVTAATIPSVVSGYDFSAFSTVVDVGGGNGTLIAAVLAANPGVRGVLFDTAKTVEPAGSTLKAAGVADRCRVETGDFFASVPRGGDGYLLKSILHDWDDESCRTILRNCRKAMSEDGRVVVVATVLPDRVTPHSGAGAAMSHLEMMIISPGQERTVAEYEALFSAAGFRLGDVVLVDSASDLHVIEALPVG